jgi:hypothetical protein
VGGGEPLGRRQVLDDERLRVEQDGVVATADRLGRVLDVRLRQPGVGRDRPFAAPRVSAPERVRVGGKRAARKLDDLGKRRLSDSAIVLECLRFDVSGRQRNPRGEVGELL